MSNIPSTAISNALIPVQQATQESVRASRLQSQKNQHHSEEVTELDETAVNTVEDESQQKGGQGGSRGKRKGSGEPEEVVEIESLGEVVAGVEKEPPLLDFPQLDISA